MFASLAMVVLLPLQTFNVTEAYVSERMLSPGRHPLPTDAVATSITNGTWSPPTSWQKIEAGKEGWFENRSLSGAYVYATYDAPSEGVMLLNAAGHSMVYVNGVPRAGDPYGYGYLTLPVKLRRGRNDLLFAVGRGRLKVSVRAVEKPIEFDLADPTLPDLLASDRGRLHGAVVVRNSTSEPMRDLSIEARLGDGRWIETKLPIVAGETIRKAPFLIQAPGKTLPEAPRLFLRLKRAGKALDEGQIDLRSRTEQQTHKRTFISRIDGSVQYFVINPAQKPSPQNHLVLSVHGASVEATSQADAYGPKDDVTVVAATNRRPYGFDWEDWGRIDALEVLDHAKRTIPHDPRSVHITGHSMGGHGTWFLGTLYPDLFASVSPSAGWISFWTYAGGWNPASTTPAEAILRRSMRASDVLGRLTNTFAQGLFVLHGDADDNVPVTEARKMREELLKLKHPDFGYHEVPGAGHWWSNEAVDWKDIFALVRRRRLETAPQRIDFTTPNPAVSSRAWWARVDQQEVPLEHSRIILNGLPLARGYWSVDGETTNVRRLQLEAPEGRHFGRMVVDGQAFLPKQGQRTMTLTKIDGRWREIQQPNQKSASRSGPFKQAYDRNMVFVYGTAGSKDENAWALERARFDAESWYYRGNGSVDVVADTTFTPSDSRNVILYGNRDTNRLWPTLLKNSPIQVFRDRTVVDGKEVIGSSGVLFLYPNGRSQLVGAVAGSDVRGMRRTDRLPIILAGTAYPDWMVLDGDGLAGAGFFDNSWKVSPPQTAWR